MPSPAAFAPGPVTSDVPVRNRNCFVAVALFVVAPVAYPRTKRLTSAGVETIPAVAHNQPIATPSLRSWGGFGGTTVYPWTYGVGMAASRGRLVRVNASGPKTRSWSTSSYGRLVAASTMSPTTMLSDCEYRYAEPGSNASALSWTYESNSAGDAGGWSGAAFTASVHPLLVAKSGIPLVCWRAWASVTFFHALGSVGSRLPIVSPSDSVPSATNASATAPLNAFETLASRTWSSTAGGVPVVTSATPAACALTSSPRWTTAMAAGGPPVVCTSFWSARSSAASAASGFGGFAPYAACARPPTRIVTTARTATREPCPCLPRCMAGKPSCAPVRARACAERRTPTR